MTKKTKEFGDYLKLLIPEIMQEFYREPWDYKIYGPISTEDPAVINVRLDIGKTKCEKRYKIAIDLYNNRAIVTQPPTQTQLETESELAK